MLGVGNIIGMFCGGLNLPQTFPFLGNTQFKILCAIASISIAVTVAISVTTIPERDPRFDPERRREAVRRMIEFSDRRKDSPGLGEPVTRQFLHEGHRI